MRGVLPRQQRLVKRLAYVVREGDTVTSIASGYTGDPSRWPELVGANLHLPLAPGAVGGTPYRVFKSLHAGQHLMVPASWPNPRVFRVLGAVGAITDDINKAMASQFEIGSNITLAQQQAKEEIEPPWSQDPTIDLFGQFAQYINGIAGVLYPGQTQIPAPGAFSPQDVIQVAYQWLPYLQQYFPTTTPPVFGQPPPTSNQEPLGQFLVNLLNSAFQFLLANPQLGMQLIPFLQAMPWDKIPWNLIPWNALIALPTQAQRREGLRMILGAGPSTASVGVGALPSGDNVDTPNFADPTIWNSSPMKDAISFGFDSLPPTDWSDLPWDEIPDAKTLDCIKNNPARLKEVVDNLACFKDDKQKAYDYICGTATIADVCKGTVAPCPTGQFRNPFANNQCQTPTVPCKDGEVFEPLKWTCVPSATPPAEKKEDKSNMPLYVGLGVAGIALVAGIVVLTARD